MTTPSSTDAAIPNVTIRRLGPWEAPGVTRLVTLVYADSYYPRDLYSPEQIVALNQAGKLVSVVAVNADGNVVGHYALERPHLEAVAESSDALVQPEYRHHNLLEEMRVLLRQEAIRDGLTGLVGYAVTNHVFSQKAEEHFGAHPCGVALGLWPSSFHNMPEPLTQRMSFAIYFKFLRPREKVVHVLTGHHERIAGIYQQYGVAVELTESAPARGPGELAVVCEAAVGTANIRVRRVGSDTVAAVRKACRDLRPNSAMKALTLELPLSQTGTAEVCHAAEEDGFYFSGLGPAFADGDDALLLQMPLEDIDAALVQLAHPFAKELLAYVDSERRRVGKK
ncbi:MAG TPA: hypothetical protein VE988_27560 [Gemmataceae bacterium]|nr:hypothetical protein [Gemmataceae bacterium]